MFSVENKETRFSSFIFYLKTHFLYKKKIAKTSLILFVISLILYTENAFAANGVLFSDLTSKGLEVFGGMREIIYAVSGFGIVAIAVGSFFGTMNWKWLVAIIIGLFVIASTAALINYMVDSEVITDEMITNSLIKGT